MELADRRRIVKAVNRGQQLDNPNDAAMAVMTARSQKRFWTYAWLLGPVSSLFVLLQDASFQTWLVNAVLITAIMGALSFFWYRRADRAESSNRERAQSKGKKKAGRPRQNHKPGGSHTPKGRKNG